MKPSMKVGTYRVYILLGHVGVVAKICSATCECAAGYVFLMSHLSPPPSLYTIGFSLLLLIYIYYIYFSFRKSASCTHVSAVLHALCALAPAAFQVQPSISATEDCDDDTVPVTSLPCQWRAPKKRKESTLHIAETIFEKHDYAKPTKRKVKLLENFDPRPPEFRGDAASRLPEFLDKVRGEQLGISLLLDSHFCSSSVNPQATVHSIPNTQSLKETVRAFKSSLEVSPEKAREIEHNTRQQSSSQLWFDVRRFKITASLFGQVLSRRVDTPPDNLVLQPKKFQHLQQDMALKMRVLL